MSPPGDSSRPQPRNRGQATTTSPAPTLAELEARAALQLRIAWLTVHADRLWDVGGGLLSAQLLDLRDLLQSCEQRGCWK
jgi:hypothetical protein